MNNSSTCTYNLFYRIRNLMKQNVYYSTCVGTRFLFTHRVYRTQRKITAYLYCFAVIPKVTPEKCELYIVFSFTTKHSWQNAAIYSICDMFLLVHSAYYYCQRIEVRVCTENFCNVTLCLTEGFIGTTRL